MASALALLTMVVLAHHACGGASAQAKHPGGGVARGGASRSLLKGTTVGKTAGPGPTAWASDGSSAFAPLLNGLAPTALAPDILNYGAHGTIAGRTFMLNSDAPMAFGDTPWPGGPPSNIQQLPLAIGSIAIYANPTGLPESFSFTTAQLCTAFSGQTLTWRNLMQNATFPMTYITPIIRFDSSGSSDVLTGYLKKVCPGFTSLPPLGASVLGTVGTTGMVKSIASQDGTIGYAACAAYSGVRQVALTNQAGQAVTCNGPAHYSALDITPPAINSGWTSVQVDNGADPAAFPTTFIEYAYVRIPSPLQAQASVAKRFANYLLSPTGQSLLRNYAFYPLPSDVQKYSCSGLSALSTTPAVTLTC